MESGLRRQHSFLLLSSDKKPVDCSQNAKNCVIKTQQQKKSFVVGGAMEESAQSRATTKSTKKQAEVFFVIIVVAKAVYDLYAGTRERRKLWSITTIFDEVEVQWRNKRLFETFWVEIRGGIGLIGSVTIHFSSHFINFTSCSKSQGYPTGTSSPNPELSQGYRLPADKKSKTHSACHRMTAVQWIIRI